MRCSIDDSLTYGLLSIGEVSINVLVQRGTVEDDDARHVGRNGTTLCRIMGAGMQTAQRNAG
jgi:hypothetical protein